MPPTLLEMLLEARLITPSQGDEALQNRVFFGGRIGTNLIELGFLGEEDLARFLSRKLGVPLAPPEKLLGLPAETLGLIPRELALKYRVIPLGMENRRLQLAMADPADLRAIDDIAFVTGQVIAPLVTPEIRLNQALARHYQVELDERYRRILEQLEESAAASEPRGEADETGGSPPAPPTESSAETRTTDPVSLALARAEGREAIADILLDRLGAEFACAALLLVRKDEVAGWRAVRDGKALDGFDLVRIPLTRPSVLKTVVEGKSYFLGALPPTPLNDRLLRALGGETPPSALLMPLLVGGRVVNILYLENGSTGLEERLAGLQRLLWKAGLAFEILISRDKILLA